MITCPTHGTTRPAHGMGHRPSKETTFSKPPLLDLLRFQVTLNCKLIRRTIDDLVDNVYY